MPGVDSFQVRVKNAIKGDYRPCMWRSLQSIALYEADRCIKYRYPSLKPFQKKIALLSTAIDLLETLDFLNDDQRQEIMFCTKVSKEPLTYGMAWRRMMRVSTEINETFLPKVKDLIENNVNSGKSHEEICELILQRMFEEANENSKSRTQPPMWGFNHSNVFTIYQIYFRGVSADPNIFAAIPPRVNEVPTEKPSGFNQSHFVLDGEDSSPSSATQFDDSVILTKEQKQHFLEEGYLQVKQIVPAELVEAALGAINAALCMSGGNIAVRDDSTVYCPGVGKSDAVLNLVKHSTVWTIAQRLLGRGNVLEVDRGQIALKPPNVALLAAGGPEKHDKSLPPKQWHIDGMDKKMMMYSPFSLLVGITLTDVVKPNCGNLCIFPKSHKVLHPLLKEQLESGMPVFSDKKCPDKPAFRNGVQIIAKAGDVIFAHQKTAHRPGPNASHMIRYQVYFRLTHKDHSRNIENRSLMEDLFLEYDGLEEEEVFSWKKK